MANIKSAFPSKGMSNGYFDFEVSDQDPSSIGSESESDEITDERIT